MPLAPHLWGLSHLHLLPFSSHVTAYYPLVPPSVTIHQAHKGSPPCSSTRTTRETLCATIDSYNMIFPYNFALSLTVPIFSLGAYFFSTPSLWYFQNCFEASLPATRLRILAPPGCSSVKSERWVLVIECKLGTGLW